jgi:diguanylate cyclase (GGDEF)-like protein
LRVEFSYNIILLGIGIINLLGRKYAVSLPEMAVLNLLLVSFYLLARRTSVHASHRISETSKAHEKLKLIYEDEHQDTEILYSLNKISLAFAEKRNLDDVLQNMLSAITSIFKTDIAFIEILPDKDTCEKKLIRGSPDFELSTGIYEKVIRRGSSILINNLSAEHSEYQKYDSMFKQGILSFLVAPLKVSHKPIGMVGIFSRGQYDFTGAELRRLSTFSTHGSLIIENARLFSATQRLSITDELTQLYNFRRFREKARDELNRAKRYDYNLSLLMCDIDYFKAYNDLNGHEAGNEALKKLAAILKASVREVDFVARYGGEEFVILLIETNKKNAVLMAERLRELVEQETFPREEKQPGGNFTITIGVAEFPTDGTDIGQIISNADKALYEGKKAGKNRVAVL